MTRFVPRGWRGAVSRDTCNDGGLIHSRKNGCVSFAANAFNTFDAAKNSQFISGLLSAQELTGRHFLA